MYPAFFHALLQDKQGMENVLLRAASHIPSPAKAPSEIIAPRVFASLPENILAEVIILRFAALAGEDALPKEGQVVRAGEALKSKTIERSAAGRFIAEECVPGRDKWVNKVPIVGY